MSCTDPIGNFDGTVPPQGLSPYLIPPASLRGIATPLPEKPKRPLSAYNLFFRSERRKLLDKLPAPREGKKPKRSHGKLGFKDMATIIGLRWRNIDSTAKSYYESVAAKLKAQYNREMKVYREASDRQQQTDILHWRLEPRPIRPTHQHTYVPHDKRHNNLQPTLHHDFRSTIEELASVLDHEMIEMIIRTFL